jgi:mono/diheme cytochrome c family protein
MMRNGPIRARAIAAGALAALAWSLPAHPTGGSTADEAARAQGKYLVENVALCGDCHTPRDVRRRSDLSHALQGAVLGFGPAMPGHPHACAPPIAGLTRWNDQEAAKFFETGLNPKGKYAKPPMPAYRFHRDDAIAVADYLKSLPPAPSNPCRETNAAPAPAARK